MGALRQLGALFWKNFLIRKRHPTFLVLEVLWPVVLFVALALMRLGFPPDHRNTCEYQERAVPSAGLVPFLQSSICTLNNNCSTREWVQERADAQKRFQAMIREIDPLLNKESTIEAFKALPTVNVVLNAVKDVADGNTVEEMDNKLVIRNMVRDPDAVVYILSDKYKILERRVAESLLDASINPLALVDSIGSVDFKGIVCDPDKLENYIILSDKSNRYIVNKYSVSNSLCRVEDDKISDITNDLIRQVDVANIIRLIQDMSNMTGSFDLAVLMEDIADLVDMYLDKSSLLSMVEDLPDLSAISGAISQIGKFVPMLNDLADMNWLGSIEEFIRRAANGLSEMDDDLNLDLLNTFGLGLPQTMSNVPLKEASDLLNLFIGEVKWEDMSFNDTLSYIENMMSEVLGNKSANMVMAMATNTMEMMEAIRTHSKKMDADLKYAVKNTDAVTVSLNTLEEAGPEMTYIFMNEIVNMKNIYMLMSGEVTTADVCKDAVYTTYSVQPRYDIDAVTQTICSDKATEAFDQVFQDNSMTVLMVQLEEEMEDMYGIMEGYISKHQEIRSMKDMYYQMMDMVDELMGSIDEDPNEWNAILANTNMDYMESYNWVWNMIGSEYKVQTMIMLPIVMVPKSAETTPMWSFMFKPWFEMLDAVLHNAMKRVEWFEEMNKEGKIITKVVKYLPYYPKIVESAFGTNLSELARVLTLTDTTELTRELCEETDWDSLDVPNEISRDEMKIFVCETNITKFVEDVWNIADPLSFLSDVELDVEYNLNNGIRWTRMVGDVQYLVKTLDGKNSVGGLLSTVFTSDLSMIYNYYTVAMDLLTKMSMDSVTSDMENKSELESTFKSLDEALGTWDLWKRVKHYIRTWNFLAKMLNEYAELTQDPDWDIVKYVTELSPTLGKYLKNSTDTMPEVIDALQKAGNNPQQMIERVTNIDFEGFCEKPESLSSLLGVKSTESFTKFQNGLCELNWTQVMDEMTGSQTPWSNFITQWEMISTYDTASLPPISLNWTDVISSTQKFMDYISKGMFDNFVPDLSNVGLTDTDSSISNLTSALQNTWEYDANQIGRSVDQIMKLLFDESAQNNTFIEMWQYSVAMQSYINYHFLKFVNIHLGIINKTGVFNLRAHLNSPKADKLFEVMENSPELNAVLLHNMKLLSTGDVEPWLSLDFNNLCMNMSKLEKAVKMPENSNITKTEVIEAICAAVGEGLLDEVRIGMEGLDEFINAIDDIVSTEMTATELREDYFKVAELTEQFSMLLVDLSTANIKVEGLPFIMDGEITRLLEQLTDFPEQLGDNYENTDPLGALQASQNETLKSLMDLQEIPEVRHIMEISQMYMRVLTAVLMTTEQMNLDPATGFKDYPEMYKMWQMMEWLPQLYVTFTYTSLVDNSKISTFTEAIIKGTDSLCEKDPYDLMTNPPILDIKFEDFFNLFCSVNFSLLEHEARDFIQDREISDTYDSLSSVSEKVDVNGWTEEYNRFIKQIEQFFSKTGEYKVPGFDNMTIWDEIYDFLGKTLMDMDTLTMATKNMDGLLEALVSISPEFQSQLKVVEITNYVMGRMLDHLENMTGNVYKLEDFFHGYGQMQHLLMMLQEPGVMETLMASINTPKFSPLLEYTNATAVILEICDSDITKYMTIPSTVTVDMNDVKDRFCDTDFDVLMTEFVDALFIKDIMDMIDTNTTIDWTSITKQNSELTERLAKWLENPPELDIPTRWENTTYWFKLLDLLNGNQTVETSDPTLDTLLKGMENFLGKQFSDIVKSFSPVALQIMQMIDLDSDAKRTFATIDLFLDYMVERLMDVSDNFTVGSLSKNSTEIIRFMEALANLRDVSNTDYEALNKTVDQEKLYKILLDPDMLMNMCEKDNVAAYISANGTASKASIALEEVICIDIDTWSEVLKDQINLEMFEEKLAEIWNETNSNVHLNWTSLANNMERFVTMLVDWMERPPQESGSLTQWTDWDGILSFFTSVYTDPRVGMNILNYINPLFGSEMNNLTNAFNKLLMPFIQQLTSNDIEELYSNPEKLGSLIESIASIEDWLTLLSRFFDAYYKPDVIAPTRESILESLVCDKDMDLRWYLEKYLDGMVYGDKSYIYTLCWIDMSEWIITLRNNSYSEWEIQKVQTMFNHAVEDKMSEHDEQVSIRNVMELLEKLNLDGLLNSSTTEDWLQNSQDTGLEGLMAVLEMIGEKDTLMEFKRVLLTIVEVQEYIKTMLDKFSGDKSIPITDILPSSKAVADFIENLASSDTVSLFTLAYVDPAKFITLMFSNDWESTICNLDKFMDTFDFPSDVNVTELQQHLCTEYASQKTYLDDIMNKLDAEEMIKNIENILMNDTVNANNETWAYMSRLVDSIVRSLIDIENTDITGVEDWFKPVIKALENMANTSETDSYEEVCDRTLQYAMSTEMYSTVKPYIDAVHSFIMISNSVMNVQIDVDEAVCQMKMKNLTDVFKYLEKRGVPGELKKIEEILSEKIETEFSCASYSTYISFFETLITSLVKVGSSNIVECVTDTVSDSEGLLMDLSKLFNAGSEVLELLQNEDIRALLDSILGTNGSTQLLDDIRELYNQQENAVKQLQQSLENDMSDITSFLQETLSTSLDSVFASLNMTFLQNVQNLTSDEIIEKLCESGDLSSLDATLQATLCGDDKELAKEVASNLANYAQTLEELEELAKYDSSSFWSKISKDLSALVGNIEGLAGLTDIVDRLGKVDIAKLGEDKELLKTLQDLLVDNGPDAILKNLNVLLDDFEILDDSNLTTSILDDVRMLAEGVFAFTSLRDMFVSNVKVSDLVKDTDYLRDYMINTMKLPVNVTEAIIDGSLSLDALISAATTDLESYICDSTKLAEIINVKNGSSLDIELVSRQFCSLDKDTVTSLVDEIFGQLDIGQLVEDFVVNGVNGILRKSNITMDETKDAIKSLVDANDDLQKITKTFNDFADTIPDAFTSLAQAQTGDQEFGSLSAILCGNAIPMISDEFRTGAVLKTRTELTPEQKQEFDALPGNACKDMYVRILKDRNGPIIWSYLKPLLRGKIVYSPNTMEAKTIVKQINTTFSSLEEFIELAVDWAEGSVALGNLTGENAKELQDLLDSNVIKSMLTEVSGVDTGELDDILYTLEDTDMNMMEGISKVAKMIRDYISCLELDRFQGYDTEMEMEEAAANLAKDNSLLAGVVFDMPEESSRKKRQSGSSIPTHIHYKIRMDVDNTPDTDRIKPKMWRPQPYDDFFTELRYFRGFAQLQDMIEEAIISLHVGENITLPSVTTNQFPYPCHTQDLFVNTIAGYLLNVLMTLSWLAAISVAVYNLVYDRERGQEETLNAMGMKVGLNWIAWFFTTMFVMAIVAIIDVLILRYGNIFIKSNIAIVYLYFIDFIFSVIMMCYFVSAFFTRTSLAILACIIVYVLSYMPYIVLYSLEVQMEFWQKTLACLSSTSAFSYAAQFISRYEEQQTGLNWDNIRDDPMYGDGFSFSWCCIMILIDGVIYFILGWYVRNVKPGKFGVAEPWYFIFNPSMWCGRGSSKEGRYSPDNEGIFAEDVQSPTPVILSARGLSKTYSDGTVAVKDLSLDIHCGNVTTLLGHNGAAKTTTMNMLIGILSPSKGVVKILNQPLKRMKGSLGICSQHNALYEYMTVKEHMEFYSSIKGGSLHGLSAKDEIRQLLKDVDLYYCRSMLVKNLSGGMQRRLCVALAFVGGSKAVILDEPTSGVDPSGRRAVWNLIIRRKSGTAVLLSTHHLDEADVISDQIAIMHEGSLLCKGSPMFLKKNLASGHRLTVVKESSGMDPVPILSMLKSWLPGTKLDSTAGSEMTFILPTVKEADFSGLFKDLDRQAQSLGIVSYGISDPHLEEVFLKVCSAADIGRKVTPETLRHIEDEETSATNGDSKDEWKHDFESSGSNGSRTNLASSSSSSGAGMLALLTKRFHHYRRDWRILISTLLLPLLLFLLGAGLYKVKPDPTSAQNLYLSPAMYGPDNYVFMQQNSARFPLGDKVLDTFMVDPGIGTSCMADANHRDPYKCVTPATKFSVPAHNASSSGRCVCENDEYKCEGSPYGAPPPQRVTTTTEILQNLNNRDINKYLLDSYPEFIMKRFGGWSFENEDNDANANLKAKIWYDNNGYHSLPAFFNAYSNGLLRALVNDDTEAPKYGISLYNHPFMFGRERLSKNSILQHAADMGIAFIILLAFTFIPVGVLLYSVNENINKEKHMQFIGGVNSFTYWISSLIWDLFILGIAVGFSVIIIVIFKPGSFWDRENLEATVCLLLLYGWATITFAYLFVKRFQNSGTAFFTVFCTLIFVGIFCILMVFSFNYFQSGSDNKKMEDAYDAMRYIFLIFPPYALGGGLLDLIDNQIKTVIYERFNTDVYQNPFSFDMLGWHMFAMGVEGCVFLFLTIWLDMRFCCKRTYECSVKEDKDEDSDVTAERIRVDTGDCRSDVVAVRNLHKIYNDSSKEVHAVNGLSFGVPSGQCFGLLGVNGAGKTSTFSVLTGVTSSSYGHCYILGQRIEPGSSTIGKNMGYCPQVDALDPYLSITNTLNFHASLKGIDGDARKQALDKVMGKLDLHKIKNKLVKSCSGGMKRKLSLAVALLGDPAVVLLDEPTSGMDPKAKRLVWNCLLEAKKNGQAIILTSHSLEECDILCDRIGIMVNGRFKCLGTSQHLKQKYGDGYTVTLYVSGLSDTMSKINDLIQKYFPRAVVTDHHVNVVQLDIPRESLNIADMFGILESEKANFNILYYTVSQTTLDTIFLNFAREQTDGATVDVSDTTSTSSDRDSYNGSSLSGGQYTNPSYGNLKTSLTDDKEKGRISATYDNAYALPAKNTFNDDQESYCSRL